MTAVIPGGHGLPSRFEGITAARAALAVAEQVWRAAGGRDALIRIQDEKAADRWADIAACGWGLAMLWNDGECAGGDSFGTLGDGRDDLTRPFSQPGGDDLEFPQRWFVPAELALRALGVYVETGRLWRGLRWWPTPPPGLMADEAGDSGPPLADHRVGSDIRPAGD